MIKMEKYSQLLTNSGNFLKLISRIIGYQFFSSKKIILKKPKEKRKLKKRLPRTLILFLE